MAKVERITDQSGAEVSYHFDCPGCGIGHSLRVESPDQQRPRWTWNGSVEAPTFSPSLLVKWSYNRYGVRKDVVCHSYVRDGRIEFLSDCTHSMAGQTIDLMEIEA